MSYKGRSYHELPAVQTDMITQGIEHIRVPPFL